MNIPITPYWAGVISGPAILVVAAWWLHRMILLGRWLKTVARGHPFLQWPYLWAVSWALPKLTKEYCIFKQADGRSWFSPRLEKFRVLPRPKQED